MDVAPSRATLRASGIMRQRRESVAAIARGLAAHAPFPGWRVGTRGAGGRPISMSGNGEWSHASTRIMQP